MKRRYFLRVMQLSFSDNASPVILMHVAPCVADFRRNDYQSRRAAGFYPDCRQRLTVITWSEMNDHIVRLVPTHRARRLNTPIFIDVMHSCTSCDHDPLKNNRSYQTTAMLRFFSESFKKNRFDFVGRRYCFHVSSNLLKVRTTI